MQAVRFGSPVAHQVETQQSLCPFDMAIGISGRYFYDLNGKRYWRNNKDGKYYLFNQSMYSNDDFKPVKKDL